MSFPEPQTVAVRTCSRCHAVKPIDEFAIKERTRGTRRSYCRPCARAYGREHYERNRAYYRTKAHGSRKATIRANRELVAEYLEAHACVDCGETDPTVLEFDHRDPATKSETIGRLVHVGTRRELIAEMAKCDVRCGNCHRRRTAAQFGSYRLSLGTQRA